MPVNNQGIRDITESNQPGLIEIHPGYVPAGLGPEHADMLMHILTDVHEILQRLDRFEREARPLLDAYKRTNGGTIGLLREARKGRRGA